MQTSPFFGRGKTADIPDGVVRVIKLKERSSDMLKNDLLLKNPIRLLEQESGQLLPAGGFGAVLARAGVGKTALIVQLALNSMLQGRRVLHISLEDPVQKVTLWYQEVLRHLVAPSSAPPLEKLWESLLPLRFIMTFRAEGFSVATLKERLNDLVQQGIFSPEVLIMDGMPFEDNAAALEALKTFARDMNLLVWFTVKTHRHEPAGQDGMPSQIQDMDHLFETLILLLPEGKDIHVRFLKGGDPQLQLRLDPATMLLKDDEP